MKNNLLLLLVLTSTLCMYGQNTYVPDDNFESKLIQLGYDSGPLNDSIPTANINQITSLSVANFQISDMTGIEDFVSLTSLNCSRNWGITNLDVTNLDHLERLTCYENNINDLDLSNNTDLTHLICYSNHLTELILDNNQDLISINCSNNYLTNLDVSVCENLVSLHCSSNQLSSLLLTMNTNLKFLYCSSNYLNILSVANNLDLRILDCSNNELNNVDLSGLPLLNYLRCTHNSLVEINVTELPLLEQLNVSYNDLTHLNTTQNFELKKLIINDNNIEILNLSNNPHLTNIDAVYNNLKYVDLRNGNNENINSSTLNLNDNDSLHCVLVDDANYSNSTWVNSLFQITFSEECYYLGSQENIELSVSLFPNPVIENLMVSTPTEANYTIYAMSGRIIKQGILTIGENNIDLSAEQRGIYIITINTDGKSITKQLSKL